MILGTSTRPAMKDFGMAHAWDRDFSTDRYAGARGRSDPSERRPKQSGIR